MELAVVRQAAIDGQRTIELFRCDDARQLMRKREWSQRQRCVGPLKHRRRESLCPTDDERGALRCLLFPVHHTRREFYRRKCSTTEIKRNQAIAIGSSEDAIGLALADFQRGAPVQRFVLDLHHVELRKLGRTRLVIRCCIGQGASRLTDDDEPERGYASG